MVCFLGTVGLIIGACTIAIGLMAWSTDIMWTGGNIMAIGVLLILASGD